MSFVSDFSDKLVSLFSDKSKYGTSSQVKQVADDIKDATDAYLSKRKLSYSSTISGIYNGSEIFTGAFQFGSLDYSSALSSAYSTLVTELQAIPTSASSPSTKKFTDAIDHFFTTVVTGIQVSAKFVGTATMTSYPYTTHPATFENTIQTFAQSTISADAAAIISKLENMTPKQVGEREKSDPYYPCPIESEKEVLDRLGASSLIDYLCQLIGQVLDNGLCKAVITVASVGSNIATASPCIVS